MTIKFAENLQMLRKEKNISQEKLAEVFGVTNQSISKWELGLSCPDITMLPKIAEYYEVSIDELLGYKPISSMNNLYIQIQSFLNSIEDDGEIMDAIYRITRLASACTLKHESTTIKKIMDGKCSNNSSILQAYGKEYGGVLIHDINSMLISSFKNVPKIEIAKVREFYKTLSNLCNINVLKVLVAFFECNNNSNINNGMTIDEVVNKTNLTLNEVYEAMNHLDIKLNESSKEERWVLMHMDTIPLLMLLTQGKNFFKDNN